MVGQAGTVHAHLASVASCVGPANMAVVIVGWYMDHASMAVHVTKPRSVECMCADWWTCGCLSGCGGGVCVAWGRVESWQWVEVNEASG